MSSPSKKRRHARQWMQKEYSARAQHLELGRTQFHPVQEALDAVIEVKEEIRRRLGDFAPIPDEKEWR